MGQRPGVVTGPPKAGFLGRAWGVSGSQVYPMSEAFIAKLNLSTTEQLSEVMRCRRNAPGFITML